MGVVYICVAKKTWGQQQSTHTTVEVQTNRKTKKLPIDTKSDISCSFHVVAGAYTVAPKSLLRRTVGHTSLASPTHSMECVPEALD